MCKRLFALLLVCLLLAPAIARGDWDRDDPHQWAQLPDPNGWDVNDSLVRILADDFALSQPGWITDIHFWGSWRSGGVGEIDKILLSIHADVPADQDPARPFSHPGETLWVRVIEPARDGGVSIRLWGAGVQGWYDAGVGTYNLEDHFETFQVNVFLQPADWFLHQGSAADPAVYWLAIGVHLADASMAFGWKTSESHWNDPAVSGSSFGPQHGPPEWGKALYDPANREALDLAFVVTGTAVPGPATCILLGSALLGVLPCRRTKKRAPTISAG